MMGRAAVETLIDYTEDLKELAELVSQPRDLDAVLSRALESLQGVVPYDLAAIFELKGRSLSVRASRGPLSDGGVKGHSLDLASFPLIQRVMETRKPMAVLDHHHEEDGDPYDGLLDLPDGHSCMLVPLFAGDRSLGIITLDRLECIPYTASVVELAGVYGQLISLAILYAEQADVLERHRLALTERNRLLSQEALGQSDAASRLMKSRSPKMAKLLRQGQQVALTDTPVLIRGETGAGKEVLAQALHGWSRRGEEAFITLNCAAIPEGLIESELFGHVKGAFSGATSTRPGRFLTANGGTLLLDEIGDLPLSAQAKLLRVLQEGTFEPVGSDKTVKVDVRVLAATHVDLELGVKEGRFREDLYYRLDVFPLFIPPLRERPEDIIPIAEQILGDFSRTRGRGPWLLSPEGCAFLESQPWPGNVRQLVNTLERATILTPSGILTPESLGAEEPNKGARLLAAPGPRQDGSETPENPGINGELLPLVEVERRYIRRVLAHTEGRIYGEGGAAEVLGLKPTTLQSRMKKLGVKRSS